MEAAFTIKMDGEFEKLLKEQLAMEEILLRLEDADENTRKLKRMELLHKYNDIKDATQVIINRLANIEQVTVAEIHKRYNLPLDWAANSII